jgi:hypothetical protein
MDLASLRQKLMSKIKVKCSVDWVGISKALVVPKGWIGSGKVELVAVIEDEFGTRMVVRPKLPIFYKVGGQQRSATEWAVLKENFDRFFRVSS